MKKIYTLLLICAAGTGYSQQGFGTSNPAPSSVIDMVASNKGALLPRVTLTNTAVAAPVPSPANALTVFNTATTGDVTPGYYYWSSADSKWIRLIDANTPATNWLLDGNAGTTSSNFLGTLDDMPLNFKIDNTASGNISKTATSYGYKSNTGTGTGNSAFGTEAMMLNATGLNNTAFGALSLHVNTNGNSNTALGNETLSLNTTGSVNTAVGNYALRMNTTGLSNTAIGANSLNTNSTGGFNTALGEGTLYVNTTGNFNTAIGKQALYTNVTGSNNTAIGTFADVTVGNLSNTTAVGYQAKVSASNSMALGGQGIYGVNVGINTATPSNKLHVVGANSLDPVRFEGLQTGAATDKVVVADANGILKTVTVAAIAPAETNTTLSIAAGQLVYGNEKANNPNVNLVSANAGNTLAAGTDGRLFVPAPAAEVDGVIGNEVTNATTNGGLTRAGTGTTVSPYTLGLTSGTTTGDLMTWSGTAWSPAAAKNIYNVDGSLTSNRTLNVNGKVLHFKGTDEETYWSADGSLNQSGSNGRASLSMYGGNNSNLFIQQFKNAEGQIFSSDNSTSLNIGTHATAASAPLTFVTSAGSNALGTEKMRVTGEGNVGINTTTPTEKLDNSGIARIRTLPLNGATNAIFTQSGGAASATQNQTFTATKTVVADANGVLGSITGVPLTTEVDGVIGNEVTDATTNGGLTRAGAGTTVSPYTLGLTSGTTAGQLMTWNGTAWAPAAPANIYNANGSLTSARTLTNNGFNLTFLGTNQSTLFSATAGFTQRGLASTKRASVILQSDDNNSDGVVSRLNLYQDPENMGQVVVDGDATGLSLGTNSTTVAAPIRFSTSAGSGAPGIIKMIITGTGNVGINTATPSAKLHIIKAAADLTPAIIEGCTTYTDNTAATTAGLPVGALYRKADGTLMVRY